MTIISKTGSSQPRELRSKAERRKNFDPRKWANKWLKSGGLPERVNIPNLDGEIRLPKTMSNEDRKKSGMELDPGLEAVACDRCGTLDADLKLIPIDRGQGLQCYYHCKSCVLGKTIEKKSN